MTVPPMRHASGAPQGPLADARWGQPRATREVGA